MKLKITTHQLIRRLAYFEYTQSCLSSDPMEIPMLYSDWATKVDQPAIDMLSRKFIEEEHKDEVKK